ncbi:hypothetical protein Vadar_012380 [Vaccinium darrowii]|uniref:Uncharacterized protein n=1 Tax=Vaccinium darrowii TaxID=229202 RepID=A0ACB7ZJT5_9ERIC|nr:hypothetical protein Vadar_012380 [Vaccinium darrowii]
MVTRINKNCLRRSKSRFKKLCTASVHTPKIQIKKASDLSPPSPVNTSASSPIVHPPPPSLLSNSTSAKTQINDPDNNHFGIDLNDIKSIVTSTAGHYNSTARGDDLIPLDMGND